MTHETLPQLSKSRFIAGLQCLKRLYLECYHRDIADPVEAGQQAVFDTGTNVGELARQRFPNGVLVQEQYHEHPQAVQSTQVLLSDVSVLVLYEPAFAFQSIRTRVDVLVRGNGQEFDLIEVKSTASAKEQHIPDVAIQMYAVEGCGVPVGRAYLMHINTGYVYQGGAYDLERLFSLEDVTEESRAYIAEQVPGALSRMWESLQLADTLDIETGPHCTTPYRCPFFGHCHTGEPEHPIRKLPGLRNKIHDRLKASGIRDIGSIPPDFSGLSYMQRRVRDSVTMGQPFVGTNLASGLAEIDFPAAFLDFETLGLAIPIYAGTSPYQMIPFQWSLHVRDSDGGLRHSAFLDDGLGDPRERLIVALLEATPPKGSIVVYSGYEARVLRELAQAFPQYEGRLVTGEAPESERAAIRESLLAYCERDTLAMVRVYEALVAVAQVTLKEGCNEDSGYRKQN